MIIKKFAYNKLPSITILVIVDKSPEQTLFLSTSIQDDSFTDWHHIGYRDYHHYFKEQKYTEVSLDVYI